MDIGKVIRLSPAIWPGKALDVQPGDMTRLVPEGMGISGPFPIRPWDDPFGPSPARYYGFQARTGQPYTDAPITKPAGGVVYFNDSPPLGDFQGLLRLMGVRIGGTQSASFFERSETPLGQRHVSPMRLVSRAALQGLFGAPIGDESAPLVAQERTLAEVLWAFIESEQEEWGTGMGGKLTGAMAGDGDWAKESL